VSLPPTRPAPRIATRPGLPGTTDLDGSDAVLIVLPADAAAARRGLRLMGHAEAIRRHLDRSRLQAGKCAAFTLPNPRQTLCVTGLLETGAGAFERLSLAGAMLRLVPRERAARLRLAASVPAAARPAALESLLAAALVAAFEMPSFRSHPAAAGARRATRIDLHGAAALDLPRIQATADATNLVRWLTAMPPNRLDARSYRRALALLARRAGLRFRWLGEAALRRAGAGAFLAVSAGNARRGDAGIAQLSWRPPGRRTARAPLALVGKGILFDTGGTNLKPHRAMLDMHTDMSGSAVAAATLAALARLRAPFAADAWLAITENRIGPTAYRPQDVVRAANGVTIQVIHTDAEGRMALADTLALAGRGAPRLIIDFATLTGTCITALTERYAGVFTNREEVLRPRLQRAGRDSGERVLCFPMDPDFDSDLESKVADVLQCAVDSKGDHILAARFLRRFVPSSSAWVHVDLAPALRSGGLAHVPTDVTGFGVRFALELLLDQDALAAAGSA
jgi:leucyl aminopeptidase